MRKWWIAFMAGAVIVGCAGGNGETGSGSTGSGATVGGSTTGGRVVPTVNLPQTNAGVNVVFLTGLGRRAPFDLYAKLGNIRFSNGELDKIPGEITGSLDGTNLKLDGFTTVGYLFSQNTATASSSYANLEMMLMGMSEEDFNGNLTPLSGSALTLPNLPVDLNLAAGRVVSAQVYLNTGSLNYDFGSNRAVFDQAAWNADNLLGSETAVPSYFSDAVAFSIGSVANRPSMQSGGLADRILLTGDSIGLARGSATQGSYDLYSPSFVESGVLTLPLNFPNPSGKPLPGAYTVLESPDILNPGLRVPALQGPWYALDEVVSNIGEQLVLVLPASKPGGTHQIVFARRSGSTITDIQVGRATITGNSGTFEVWSIDQINAGTENNKTSGVLNNFTVVGGKVNDGDYTVTTTGAGFSMAGSGVFAVYN